MKKYFFVIAALVFVVALSACSKDDNNTSTTANSTTTTTTTAASTTTTTTAATTTTTAEVGNFNVADGQYFAIDSSFSNGYKYWVVVTVENKFITNVVWNAYNIDGGAASCLGEDKLTCAAAGNYGMNWDVQAEASAQWVVDNQSIDIPLTTDGKTDAITSVSIHVNDFKALLEDALDSTAVAHGDYTDGYYYEATDTSVTKDYTYDHVDTNGDQVSSIGITTETGPNYTFASILVVNGTIVLFDINATQNLYDFAVDNDGNFITTANGDSSVKQVIMVQDDDNNWVPQATYVTKEAAGDDMYGMNWNEQMGEVANKIIADQDFSLNGDGLVDGLSSVSVEHSLSSVKTVFDAFVADATDAQ